MLDRLAAMSGECEPCDFALDAQSCPASEVERLCPGSQTMRLRDSLDLDCAGFAFEMLALLVLVRVLGSSREKMLFCDTRPPLSSTSSANSARGHASEGSSLSSSSPSNLESDFPRFPTRFPLSPSGTTPIK